MCSRRHTATVWCIHALPWPEGGLEYAPASAKRIGERLAKYIDSPVWSGERTLALRKWEDRNKIAAFKVVEPRKA